MRFFASLRMTDRCFAKRTMVRETLAVATMMLLALSCIAWFVPGAFGSGTQSLPSFAASTAYAANAKILDSSGDVEIAMAPGGTSGSSVPTWPAVNHYVKDTSNAFYWLNAGPQIGTEACVGGSPDYCATLGASQRMLQNAIIYPAIDPIDGGPAVGIPFHDSDTGARITRITDETTNAGLGLGSGGSTFVTNASDEAYSCSNFNPAAGVNGGYLCWFQDLGNNWDEALIDATTMETNVFERNVLHNTEMSSSWTDPWAFFMGGNMTFDAWCNGAVAGVIQATPTPDPFCGSTLGSAVPLGAAITSSNCPNFPAGVSGTLGEVQADSTDTIFSGYVHGYVMVVWNRSTGHCDWYDTATNTVGGSDISGVQHTVGFQGLPAPLSQTAPSVGGSGGSFTTGDAYCYDETLLGSVEVKPGNYGEETTPGPVSCTVALTAGQEITVTKPPLGSDSISVDYAWASAPQAWNVYACQEATVGTPCTPNVIQNAAYICWSVWDTSAACPTAYSTWTFPSFVSSGAAPPATNTSGFMIHQGRINVSGNYVYFTGGGADELGGGVNTLFTWILRPPVNIASVEWLAATPYVAGNVIVDSGGNMETAQTPFTSGASAPSWCSTTGCTTTDNGGTWMESPQGATNAVHVSYLGAHTFPAGNFVLFNDGSGTDTGGVGWWNTKMEQIPVYGTTGAPLTIANPHLYAAFAGVKPLPSSSGADDFHPSWAADYGGHDDEPVCASSDARSDTGLAAGGQEPNTLNANGSQIRWPNPGFNPDFGAASPGNNEIICEATDGTNRVWRFGHHRSTLSYFNSPSAPYNNWYAEYVLGGASHDGRIMLFTSTWEFDLGSDDANDSEWTWIPNTSYTASTLINAVDGCVYKVTTAGTSGATMPAFPTAPGQTVTDGGVTWTNIYSPHYTTSAVWAASTPYSTGSVILDSHGNFEIATTGGTSGSGTHPTWNTSNGGTTADNGIIWTIGKGCPTTAGCRHDVFVIELK